MQTPVMKRSATTVGEAGSTSRIAALAPAATSAEAMKNLRGSIRSARPRKALVSVPATKPAWTALVKSEAECGSIAPVALSAGTMAEAENHSAMAATWQTAMVAIAVKRCDGMAPTRRVAARRREPQRAVIKRQSAYIRRAN